MITLEFVKECNLEKLDRELEACYVDYMYAKAGGTFIVLLDNGNTPENLSLINSLVAAHTTFDVLAYVNSKKEKAMSQFLSIKETFKNENIAMGITAAGKTKLIQDTMQACMNYGNEGSLTEAIVAAQAVVVTVEMCPFITEERKVKFIALLQDAYNTL